MKEVLIISTGGTIVSVDHGSGAVPDSEAALGILQQAGEFLREEGYSYSVESVFGEAGCDSSDISPAEWLTLSQRVNGAVSRGIKKILIIHGTDTMAYTAAWLSLTADPDAAVVLTGSQRTPESPDFDGESNLHGAARLLCGTERGVFIHFDGRVYEGAFVHKEDAEALSAYVSTGGGALPRSGIYRALERKEADWRAAATEMALVALHPAALPRFDFYKILILIGYGAGNMPQRLRRQLAESFPAGGRRPLIIAASSCARGRKNPAFYGGVGIAELAKESFSVFSQGSYSLEFLIALSYLSLLVSPEEPENILQLYLEKF
ncbi:MAG: asparaginase domain-containing protein [Synergistaceae bacterium]|nr:asparaginase domain-containing protein [Synergistaceae bacterium]